MKVENEKTEQALIDEALKVYKIPKEYVFNSRIDHNTGEAVILTRGGKKLRHRKGDKASFDLSQTDITGEPPEEDLVWSKKYNQRLDLKRLLKIRNRRG